MYEKLQAAFDNGNPVAQLMISVSKDKAIPAPGNWAKEFENTTVLVGRVIAY